MNNTDNTEWRLSAKGNYWRKKNDVMLVVGTKDEETYWVRVGDSYLEDWKKGLYAAQKAAEAEVR